MTAQSKDRQNPAREGGEKDLLPQRFQHLAAIAVVVISLLVFFHEIVIEEKTFLSSDNLASHSFDTMLSDAREQGIFPLWNPYIFCGMPAYGSLTLGGERLFDILGFFHGKVAWLFGVVIFNPTSGWVIFYYAVFGAGIYLVAWHLLRHKTIALMTALATTFSMYIIVWIMIGHNTKIAVIAFFPFIFYCIERLRERWNLGWMLLLVVCIHYLFIPAHVQMIFYVYFAVGIYLLFFLAHTVANKGNWQGVIRAGAVFLAATIMAFGMDADKYLSVLEYNPFSIRGSNPIVQTTNSAQSKTVEGGLDYDYATNWSLGVGEMTTFLVPSWYGFGVNEYRGPLTNNQPYQLNTYVGPQPFTHAPPYMGAIILILAIIGLVHNRKDPFVQYLGVMTGVSLLIAFGKEFPVLYDLMYKYFPTFNKFRVPSMILVLVQIMVPLLAGYGLLSLLALRKQSMTPVSAKKWKYVLGGLAAVAVVGLVAPSVVRGIYGSFFSPQALLKSYSGQPPAVIQELYNFMVNMVVTDVIVVALLLLVAFGSIYLCLKKSLSLQTTVVILVAVVVVDLWRVAYKPMETQDRQQLQQHFTTPDYVRFLQQDSTAYRVLQLVNGEAPYDNTLAYWRIQNAFGYQGAKMRAYQDMVDVVGLQNPLLWSLMNVKYIISNQPDSLAPLLLVYNGAQMKVYHNTANLPRAYFVNRYEVAGGKEILDKIAAGAFDPRDVAFFMEDPKKTIEPPQTGARAEVVRYGIQDLELKVTASGNNLLVLSETYYPVGWKAYIDGNPTEIYRVNYLFRGVIVPPGVHTLTMRFEPRGFYLGKNLSLAVNILVLGALGYFWVVRSRKRELGKEVST